MKILITLFLSLLLAAPGLFAQDSQAVMEKDGVAQIDGGTLKISSMVGEQVYDAGFNNVDGAGGTFIIWFSNLLAFKSGALGGAGDKASVTSNGDVHFQGRVLGGGSSYWNSQPVLNPHSRYLEGNWTANGTTFASTGNFTERGAQLSRWRGTATADPTAPEAGDIYLNTSSGKVRIHSGSAWIDLN